MRVAQAARYSGHADPALDFDAVIIGAGVSGLYQLYKLRELGMRARIFETGSGVGGTWYWNRYPGARFDSESYTYAYSFSQELLEEWSWAERFAGQAETERYLNHVADKFDLRRDIQFNSRVVAAHYCEETRSWDGALEDGRRYSTRFLIPAIGVLSAPTMPRISGVESFRGQSFHTHYWPKEPVSFAGKRVGVIGTGATAVQAITEIAKTVGHLTVFQRTPNWCAPLHNAKIGEDEMRRARCHRHGRHRGAGDHRNRQNSRPSDRVSAHPQLVRAAAQRQDRRGRDAPSSVSSARAPPRCRRSPKSPKQSAI